MRTRAAVLSALGATSPYAGSRPLLVEELELDPPGPGEVLVRIKAAGLCHSDLSVINGDRPRPVLRGAFSQKPLTQGGRKQPPAALAPACFVVARRVSGSRVVFLRKNISIRQRREKETQ